MTRPYPLQTCRAYYVAEQMMTSIGNFVFALRCISGAYHPEDPVPFFVWEYFK